MFPNLQLEVMERFTEVEQYFRNSPKAFTKPAELGQTAKGLAFIQIYAIYEHTVKAVTRTAIQQIASHGHVYSNLKFPLLAVFLDPQMKSFRDCGDSDAWQRRFDLLKKSASKEVVEPVDAIPSDGTHFRHSQVELILQVLGVRRKFTRRKRHLYRIDGIVHHRNMISHGEETAVEVGRRYSRNDVLREIRFMKSICLRLIEIVSEHCSTPDHHLG